MTDEHMVPQLAGHEPGEWMKPDFADLMPEIAASGGRSVLVVPIQFLADHLEILYDIDVGAREQAERWGLVFHRIRSLNTDSDFVESLATVVRRTLQAWHSIVFNTPQRGSAKPTTKRAPCGSRSSGASERRFDGPDATRPVCWRRRYSRRGNHPGAGAHYHELRPSSFVSVK